MLLGSGFNLLPHRGACRFHSKRIVNAGVKLWESLERNKVSLLKSVPKPSRMTANDFVLFQATAAAAIK